MTPSEIRATVLSTRNLIIRLSFVIIGPILGWYADRSGLPSALIAVSLFFLTTSLLSALFLIHTFREKTLVDSPKAINTGDTFSRLKAG
jgi:hypothetical protein